MAVRSTIDAAVERMRAGALADHRPSTPGSHIDWAGDDDDESLPDLNDWGVSSVSSIGPPKGPDPAELDKQLISPLMVEGLKPLPEPVAKAPGTPPTKGLLPSLQIPAAEASDAVIDRSHSPSRSREGSPARGQRDAGWRPKDDARPRSRGASPNPSPVRESKPITPSYLPPKPSFLPAKPNTMADMPARSSAASASPMRSPISPNRARSRSPMNERRPQVSSPGSPRETRKVDEMIPSLPGANKVIYFP